MANVGTLLFCAGSESQGDAASFALGERLRAAERETFDTSPVELPDLDDRIDLEPVLRDLCETYGVDYVIVASPSSRLAFAALHAGIPSLAIVGDREANVPGTLATVVEFADRTIVTSERARELVDIDTLEARGNAANTVVLREARALDASAIALDLTEARKHRVEVEKLARSALASPDFDAAFHEGAREALSPLAERRAALDYASRAAKGLACCNPRAGLNEGARAARGTPLCDVPNADTHRCSAMSGIVATEPSRLRIALHLHLYYSELSAEFRATLDALDTPIDLIVTHTSPGAQIEIERAFRGYALGRVTTVGVANRGRDVAAFVAVGGLVRAGAYDVVGHLHGKRSLEADASGRTGDLWRRFHIDTLLGDADYFGKLMSLFASDARLGLIFPEDRRAVGWQLNAPIARAVAARLVPQQTLPVFPIFPIGTAFWARPEAMEPLWRLGLDETDFPPEPLPYDATLPHALECLIPSICENAGFHWSTVLREGYIW